MSDDASAATTALMAFATSMHLRSAAVEVSFGPDAGRRATIDTPTFCIGTGDRCDLRLTNPTVSREHLRLSLSPEGLRCRDDSSKNGTLLGGVRIHDVLLTNDAMLSVGGTGLAIHIGGDVDWELSPVPRFGEAIGGSTSMRFCFAMLEKAASSRGSATW